MTPVIRLAQLRNKQSDFSSVCDLAPTIITYSLQQMLIWLSFHTATVCACENCWPHGVYLCTTPNQTEPSIDSCAYALLFWTWQKLRAVACIVDINVQQDTNNEDELIARKFFSLFTLVASWFWLLNILHMIIGES